MSGDKLCGIMRSTHPPKHVTEKGAPELIPCTTNTLKIREEKIGWLQYHSQRGQKI
jgi:hypothetical protein